MTPFPRRQVATQGDSPIFAARKLGQSPPQVPGTVPQPFSGRFGAAARARGGAAALLRRAVQTRGYLAHRAAHSPSAPPRVTVFPEHVPGWSAGPPAVASGFVWETGPGSGTGLRGADRAAAKPSNSAGLQSIDLLPARAPEESSGARQSTVSIEASRAVVQGNFLGQGGRRRAEGGGD